MIYSVGNGIFKPGGYGGGIFDGNLSGLGAEYSEEVANTQRNLNLALTAHDMCPIEVDGKMGKVTCGASRYLGVTPPGCTSFVEPRSKAQGCSAPSAPVATMPSSTPALAPPAPAVMQFGTAPDWKKYIAFAAGALVVAGGLYWFTRRKKGTE